MSESRTEKQGLGRGIAGLIRLAKHETLNISLPARHSALPDAMARLVEELYLYRLSLGLYILDGLDEVMGERVTPVRAARLSDEIGREFASMMGWEGRVSGEFKGLPQIAIGMRSVEYREVFYNDLVDYERGLLPFFLSSARRMLDNAGLGGDEGTEESFSSYLSLTLPGFVRSMQTFIESWAAGAPPGD